MSVSLPQIQAGAILAGRWQIQDFIGSGESGEVYGVRDMHGVSTFALKLFWPNALEKAELWSAVQQTARTASGLGVDGVARACDFGVDANSNRPFFVTERVSWSSLADRVRMQGPLTPAEMSTALVVLARALDGAHAAGVCHRDLKPENVFVSPNNANWVRISDFGVALLRAASPAPPGWGGSVGWVAPDAADPKARSTPAMDIFSLGLVCFFALSGGSLHRAARRAPIDPNDLWAELGTPLDSASLRARELGASLDPGFDAWFQRAVAPSAQDRFNSAAEMASAFDAVARTLIAPQGQNAVALPGIAAAIAQPLVFQLDAPRSAPESAPPAAPASTILLDGAGYGSAPEQVRANPAPTRKSSLLLGGAAVLFAVTGLGFAALYHRGGIAAETAPAAAVTSSGEAREADPAVAVTPLPSPDAAVASTAPRSAAPPAAQPTALSTASKPAASAAVLVTPVARAALIHSTASAATPLKTVAKPAAPTPPKKKCGSTFIPCK